MRYFRRHSERVKCEFRNSKSRNADLDNFTSYYHSMSLISTELDKRSALGKGQCCVHNGCRYITWRHLANQSTNQEVNVNYRCAVSSTRPGLPSLVTLTCQPIFIFFSRRTHIKFARDDIKPTHLMRFM